eukprot:254817_1
MHRFQCLEVSIFKNQKQFHQFVPVCPSLCTSLSKQIPNSNHITTSQSGPNKMLHLVTTIYMVTSVAFSITCVTRSGPETSGVVLSSEVTCSGSEIMVSCGIAGSDEIGGSVQSNGVCTAWDYSPQYAVEAKARCCEFPSAANAVATTEESTSGVAVSVSCPENTVMTGCSTLLVSGVPNQMQGSFVGSLQNEEWTGADNQCNAKARSGTSVKAIATCVSVDDAYLLSCQTRAQLTREWGFGSCPTGYAMTGCQGYSPKAGLEDYWIDGDQDEDRCYIKRQEMNTLIFATGICCDLISGCVSAGYKLTQKHQCECRSECGEGYCNSVEFVASKLGDIVGEGLCSGDDSCCCSCPNCVPYIEPF